MSFDSEVLHSVKERHQRLLSSSTSSSNESTKEAVYQDSEDLNASCAEKIPQGVSLEYKIYSRVSHIRNHSIRNRDTQFMRKQYIKE